MIASPAKVAQDSTSAAADVSRRRESRRRRGEVQARGEVQPAERRAAQLCGGEHLVREAQVQLARARPQDRRHLRQGAAHEVPQRAHLGASRVRGQVYELELSPKEL